MPPLESRPGELPEPREECISLKYLLDANVLSDFARGHRSVTTRLRREAPLQLAFRRSPRWKSNTGSRAMANLAPRLRAAMRTLLDTISVVPFEREDARVAAQLRATLNSQGTPIGAHDLLLAACALRRGPVIVTHNAREFVGVGGLGLPIGAPVTPDRSDIGGEADAGSPKPQRPVHSQRKVTFECTSIFSDR